MTGQTIQAKKSMHKSDLVSFPLHVWAQIPKLQTCMNQSSEER